MAINAYLGQTQCKIKLVETMKDNPVKGTVIAKDEDEQWRLGVYDAASKQTRVFEKTIADADDCLVATVGKKAIEDVMNFIYDVADCEGDANLMELYKCLEERIVKKYRK